MSNRVEQRRDFGPGLLSKKGEERLHKILERADYWHKAYKEATGTLFGLSESMGVSHCEAEKFILELAKIDMDSANHFGILPATIDVLEKLYERGIVLDSRISHLLLDSIVIDENAQYCYNGERRARLVRSLVEGTCLDLIQALRIPNRRLGIDVKSNLVSLKLGRKESQIPVEYFSCPVKLGYFIGRKVRFVRVGHLFFVDESLRSHIPQEILGRERTNIIFVPNIEETEFGGSLGYYTCNTIASLICANMKGLTILDCGTGTGILSVAALRLGASKVLGVDIDSEGISQARQLALANGYSNSDRLVFLKEDLRRQKEIVSQIADMAPDCQVGCISNLGHWPDYPISNFTNIFYIKAMRDVGLQPRLFVAGGHGEKGTRTFAHETVLLSRLGLKRKEIPGTDIEADKMVLRKFGFSIKALSDSEELLGTSHHAGSLVATT